MILGGSLALLFTHKLTTVDFIADQPAVQKQETEEKAAAPVNLKGRTSFQQNCQSCHAMDKDMTGPGLRGVTTRGPWTDKANLVKWVHNPASFIATNAYAKELQKTYGQIMPAFPQLSEQEINDIFDYVENAK